MSGLLSNYLRRRRNAMVREYINGDVLDIGCGSATIAGWLDAGQQYVGVEAQEAHVNYLSTKYPQHTFMQRDIESEPLLLGGLKFDTVLMLAVVEHLATPHNVIGEVARHMKPASRLVITTPTGLGGMLHRAGARLGLFSRYAVVDHKRLFSRDDLSDLLAQAGIGVVLYRTFEFGANQLCVGSLPMSPG